MQKIGILRGGPGDEYYLSLESGARIMKALQKEGYDVLDMLVDKDGILHIKGIPATLEQVSSEVDMVWNTLQGQVGEYGMIQELLEELGIPYSGSGVEASKLTANKLLAKDRARELGLKTPEAVLVMPDGTESVSAISQNIYKRMAPPWVLKPLIGGSSINTYFAFTPLELSQFVDECVSSGQNFIVEQYIYGREAAVGVIDGFRGQDKYVLPVVEIKSPSRGVLTHDARKADGHAVVTGGFRSDEREQLSMLARDLHSHMGANDYSMSEFIVDKYGKIWYIETDTIPHLGDHNPFVKALKHVGSSVGEFVKSIIGRK